MKSLIDTHDALILDLDGTVWEGGHAIESAVDVINSCGLDAIYVTNNASRSAQTVADMLCRIGVGVDESRVLTSGRAVTTLALKHVPKGSKVLVVGADSLRQLAKDAGFAVVASADDQPAAVLQGFDPAVDWAQLTEAALSIRAGAQFFASNLDTSLPMERGLAVGNGSLVAAVTSATGVEPMSAGKPGPEMFYQAAKAINSTMPLAVGDRLDTDIQGGNDAAMDTFHVLTGVSGPLALIEAPVSQRPTFIGATLSDLALTPAQAAPGAQGGFTARVDGDDVLLERGDNGATSIEALRTVLEVAWMMPRSPKLIRPCSDIAEQATEGWW